GPAAVWQAVLDPAAQQVLWGMVNRMRLLSLSKGAIWTGTLCLFFLGILSPANAACTTLPFTLLPGVPPDGAQMMADLNALNTTCLPLTSLAQGQIILIFPAGNNGGTTAGITITPDGSAVPNLATTVTGGFNEVEAYAFLNGWGVWVIGTGEYQG